MFSFNKSIIINKTPHEVFEFVANPANNSLWRADVISTKFPSHHLSDGDLIEETLDFAGPKSCMVEVVEVVPDHKLAMETISGISYLPKRLMLFDEEGGHTRVTAKISGHTDGFTRIIEPLPMNLFSIRWDNYLFSLKRVMEQA